MCDDNTKRGEMVLVLPNMNLPGRYGITNSQ